MPGTVRDQVLRSAGSGHTMAWRQRDVSRALLRVCRGQAPELPDDPATVAAFVDAVRLHRIAPLAHVVLRDAGSPLADEFAPDRRLALVVHLQASAVLHQLDERLGDIPWAAFKGPVLSEFAHPVVGLRTYRDIDVVVGPGDLRAVTAVLGELGWQVGDSDDMLRDAAVPGEMHWLTPSDLYVDLHWSMVNAAVTRHRMSIPTGELLARRRAVQLGLGSAWVLDTVDAMVHVCLHAGVSGGNRLLWMVDIDQSARQVTDWDLVVERATAWGAAPQVGVVLQRARRTLGTPVPLDVTTRLLPAAGVRTMASGIDRLRPVSRVRSDSSVLRLVAKGARGSTAATVVEWARRTGAGIRERVAPPPKGRWRPASPVDVQQYLAAVESEAASPAEVP